MGAQSLFLAVEQNVIISRVPIRVPHIQRPFHALPDLPNVRGNVAVLTRKHSNKGFKSLTICVGTPWLSRLTAQFSTDSQTCNLLKRGEIRPEGDGDIDR